MMKYEKLIVPILGILLASIPTVEDIVWRGELSIGPIHLIILTIGALMFGVGLWRETHPISAILSVSVKEIALVTSAVLFLFVPMDLLLGALMPKVYTPTAYGWTVLSNATSKRLVEDTQGNMREVTVETFEHGFKRWPTRDRSRRSILIIGDSFTAMEQVSNGEEWYSYIEKAFPKFQTYVFGGGGYGTLQE